MTSNSRVYVPRNGSVLTFVGGAVVLAPAAALVALVACVVVALASRSFA
jgi:hypothetical protein